MSIQWVVPHLDRFPTHTKALITLLSTLNPIHYTSELTVRLPSGILPTHSDTDSFRFRHRRRSTRPGYSVVIDFDRFEFRSPFILSGHKNLQTKTVQWRKTDVKDVWVRGVPTPRTSHSTRRYYLFLIRPERFLERTVGCYI